MPYFAEIMRKQRKYGVNAQLTVKGLDFIKGTRHCGAFLLELGTEVKIVDGFC